MNAIDVGTRSSTVDQATSSATVSFERPTVVRRDTDQILSYYQSADAGRDYAISTAASDRASYASSSTRSSSPSSTYSSHSVSERSPNVNGNNPLAFPVGTPSICPANPSRDGFTHSASASPAAVYVAQAVQPQRRTSTRSSGGSDKRRVALVEMDQDVFDAISSNDHGSHRINREPSTSSSTSYYSDRTGTERGSSTTSHSSAVSALLSRRGIDDYRVDTLAFVAPPDASPIVYTDLTPPLSAPAVDRTTAQQQLARHDSAHSSASGHQRSKSEAVRPVHANRLRKSSRDIGIVGTSMSISPTTGQMRVDLKIDEAKKAHTDITQAAQVSPIFQTPSLSQSSLLPAEGALPSERSHSSLSSNTTSTSDDAKRHSQVDSDSNISPVIVGASPSQLWQAPSMTSVAYANYASSNGSIRSTTQYVTSPQVIPSALLYYQPGIHATAGPLPSPPRQIFPPSRDSPPPPRPPRLHAPNSSDKDRQEARQRSRSPEMHSSVLPKKSSDASMTQSHIGASTLLPQPLSTRDHATPSKTKTVHVDPEFDETPKGIHTREGAFPAGSVFITHATPPREAVHQDRRVLNRRNTMEDLVKDVNLAIDEAGLGNSDIPPPSAVGPPRNGADHEHNLSEQRSGLNLRHESSRSTFKGAHPPLSPSSDYSDEVHEQSKPLPDPFINISSHSHMPPPTSFPAPSEQVGKRAPSPHRQVLDYAMKRFSALPRTPSKLSMSKASQRSSLSQERISPRPRIFLAKIKSPWPDAMDFGDVLAKKSSLERSFGYARKLNELANHDSGLGDWVMSTKRRLTKSQKMTNRRSISPVNLRSPTEKAFAGQARHVSRGSIGSEMTFPKRVDAYVATDLSWRPSEDQTLPEGPPPALPYPTLAQGAHVPPSRSFGGASSASSMRSVPSTPSSSKSSGFFASIGRKTSIKRERTTASSSTTSITPSAKLLSKRQQAAPAPRPIQLSSSPSLPGGPRAPPGRIQRAQSVLAPSKTPAPSVAPSHAESENEFSRKLSTHRSPSLAPSSTRSAKAFATESMPDFEQQVAKLADLLPHADKAVLAGYLRRSGQDILAIGQYLEDEKNGTIRR